MSDTEQPIEGSDEWRVFAKVVTSGTDIVKFPELIERHLQMCIEALDSDITKAGYKPVGGGGPFLRVFVERMAEPDA